MRSSRHLRQSFARMLDMGGAPGAATIKNTKSMDASKNNKIQAICFDFDLLTRSIDNSKQPAAAQATTTETPVPAAASTATPNVGMVEEMANLLNVKLGGGDSSGVKPVERVDDLSALTGGSAPEKKAQPEQRPQPSGIPSMDIRDKYASKLRHVIDGGVAGIQRANITKEEALTKGDAAGHLQARAMAVESGGAEATKWMALTGTGALLTYVSNRSLKIALLPQPNSIDVKQESKRMNDFAKQLSNVSIDLLIESGEVTSDIVGEVLTTFDLQDPTKTLVVSDRDDYLSAAKEAGMTTCRVRPHSNAPRGNITAHYNVATLPDVEDVVNEVNGISFNAVFAAK